MIDFTKKGNQSTLLYNTSSISSSSCTNNSTTTTSSSVASGSSSIISSETASFSDPYNLSFLTENQKVYHSLMDDLSIIDNIHDTIICDQDSNKQVIDIARHVSLKHQALLTLLQSEVSYVNDLFIFHESFGLRLKAWVDNTSDKDVIAKLKNTPAREDLNMLLSSLHEIATIHASLLEDLKERVRVWGPTQLISDIFDGFYNKLTLYEPFMHHHPKFIMLLDVLYKLPTFTKFLEAVSSESKNRAVPFKMNDILHYIYTPLHRLNVYCKSLRQLGYYSDPSHPDYYCLQIISRKFKSLETEWFDRVHDCQSHLMVLEAFRTIQECPINVTKNRRLLLFAHLIKVDLDDITLTTDIRMYFLYNDKLIYCKKQREKRADLDKKLVYKGTLNLRGAQIRQLAPSFLMKMCEVKKSIFRIGKKSSDSNSLPGVEAFGFELVTSDVNINAMSPLHQNYQSASAGAGAPIIRRHVIRTRSQAEQNVWFETMRKAIAASSEPNLPLAG
ncbi:Dbl homology domain-containing protein [Thamnidium elegans]|nr:Dbl homology domain-containing protein [Thamnidium elegans]